MKSHLLGLLLCAVANAETFTYSWPAQPSDPPPKASITPLLFGKTWAYSMEIDDSPVQALEVGVPMFAEHHFTDAPPGIKGGHTLPFVGGVGLIVGATGTSNNTRLSWDQVRQMQADGWTAINHSYLHAERTWGDPPEILTAEQFRRDFYWSQTVLAAEAGNGRAPAHFIFPNGYTDYRNHFAEFGIRSGSRVGTPRANVLSEDSWDDIGRNYLDEGAWKDSGKGEPMHGIPETPKEGEFVIDFTHGFGEKPESENRQRWATRLSTIEQKFGAKGDDSLWSAPPEDVVSYTFARNAATVTAEPGKLTVTLPDDAAGSPLTVKLTVPAGRKLDAPVGGVVYRDGDTAWLTTPMLGKPGVAPPSPAARRVLTGEFADVNFKQPIQLAGVRVMQSGPVAEGYRFTLTAITPDGDVDLVPDNQQTLPQAWGTWRLLPIVPDRGPITVTGLRVSPEKNLKQMEVWAVE